MKTVKAQVSIEVWAECPVCAESTDLTTQENFFFEGNKLPDPDKSHGEFYCEKCHADFIVDGLEY